MTDSEAQPAESTVETPKPVVQVSDFLKPTLQDNDFLQSFVRIGLDEAPESRRTTFADERHLKRYTNNVLHSNQ